jgi:hypothetical protein
MLALMDISQRLGDADQPFVADIFDELPRRATQIRIAADEPEKSVRVQQKLYGM